MRGGAPIWITAAVTLAACLAVLAIFHNHSDSESDLIAQQHLKTLDVAYRSTIEMYRLDIETRLAAQVLVPSVTDLLAEAGRETDADRLAVLRGRLYRALMPAYRQMKAQGLAQFHFHLVDGRSFLRFISPALFGDDLFAVRPSVRIANRELRPVSGFEGGRHMPGFRNVHPIVVGDRHFGSVEISMPFEKIHENLVRLLPAGAYALLVHRRGTTDIVFSEQRE